RRMSRLHGPKFRYSHLKIREHFQEERFKSLVSAVDLVDQQDRRSRCIGLKRLQQRSLDQKALGKYVVFNACPVTPAFSFRQSDGNHLSAVVPFVDSSGNIQSLITLQSDQTPPERRCQNLGDLGLADSCLTLDEQRPTHAQGEVQHRRQRTVRDVVGLGQQIEG